MRISTLVIAALGISALAIGGLSWLLYGREAHSQGALDQILPAVNAGWNALSTFFLISGFLAVRRGNVDRHKKFMTLALAASAAFFVTYLIHHYLHGDTPYGGGGWTRPFYFGVLGSHVVLSVFGLPLILITYYLGLAGRIPIHKKMVRFTFPIWLYVSITGVVIYFMLKSGGAV